LSQTMRPQRAPEQSLISTAPRPVWSIQTPVGPEAARLRSGVAGACLTGVGEGASEPRSGGGWHVGGGWGVAGDSGSLNSGRFAGIHTNAPHPPMIPRATAAQLASNKF